MTCIFLVCILWWSRAAFAASTSSRAKSILAGMTGPDSDGTEIALLGEMERQAGDARHWLSSLECETTDGHSADRGRRDPHDLLHHFGFTQAQSKLLAIAARALQNVTSVYGKRALSALSPEGKRQLCFAAGFNFTVEDCPPSAKYRTINGACNNLVNVNWGKAFSPFIRVLPAAYADDLANPRLASSGKPLPGARDVSIRLIEEDVGVDAGLWTVLGMHFGQFLDHDIDHAALENVNCTCDVSDKCQPIPIPDDDPFFQAPCLKFARSIPVPDPDCNAIPQQQINQITSFLDLSSVYGSSLESEIAMRDAVKGKGLLLAMDDPHNDAGKQLLPNDEEHKDCVFANPELKCGRAGDVRAAEQPGLTSLHTVLLRQHNRLAEKLFEMNPDWDDDTLYKEARKICIAMWQHIVYNEYLPPLLGSQNMAEHGLRVHPDTPFYGYDPFVNPGVFNVFSAAAFRIGHTQVPSNLLKLNRDYEIMDHVSLSESFFNATHMNTSPGQEGIDAFIRGMIVQKLPKIDLLLTRHLTNHMFADPPGGEGLDLVALNIQRGRDHGIAPYNDWRVHCGLPRANTFDTLRDHMTEATIQKFRDAYEDVDDIDLFPTLIAEEPVAGQLTGPTLACLLGRQFHTLKFGDRFWYENGLGEKALTTAQLREIRKVTLARLFCDNLNDLPTIQPYVFREPDLGTAPSGVSTNSFYKYSSESDFPDGNGNLPGFFNGRVSCTGDENIPVPSLEPWKEGYVDTEVTDSQSLPFRRRQVHETWYKPQDQP